MWYKRQKLSQLTPVSHHLQQLLQLSVIMGIPESAYEHRKSTVKEPRPGRLLMSTKHYPVPTTLKAKNINEVNSSKTVPGKSTYVILNGDVSEATFNNVILRKKISELERQLKMFKSLFADPDRLKKVYERLGIKGPFESKNRFMDKSEHNPMVIWRDKHYFRIRK